MRFFYLVFTICFLSACSNNSNKQNWDKTNIRLIEPEDQRAIDAINASQEALPKFIDAFLTDSDSSNLIFYVKSMFEESNVNDVEHMWSVLLEINDDEFLLELDNEPYYLQNIAIYDTFRLHKSKVEDFIIYQNDSVILGNYFQNEFAE